MDLIKKIYNKFFSKKQKCSEDKIVKIDGIDVKIGKYTYGYEHISILSWDDPKTVELEIGRYTSISYGLKIFTGGNHRTDWITTYPFGHIPNCPKGVVPVIGHPKPSKPVIIGNDVWIGRDVTIMSGIKIGDGAVIGANSHVVNDVAPYSIVSGNPAKEIKKRFSEDIITNLVALKWWNWDDEKILNSINLLCSNVSNETLEKLL